MGAAEEPKRVYVAKAKRGRYETAAFFLFIAVDVVLAVLIAMLHLFAGVIVLLAGVFLSLALWIIVPRRYEVTEDEIRVVLGGPFRHRLPLSTVDEVRIGVWHQALAYAGVRYALAPGSVVEITRTAGLNVVISPAERDEFVLRVNEVLERYRASRHRD
jgi:hypothetical protein